MGFGGRNDDILFFRRVVLPFPPYNGLTIAFEGTSAVDSEVTLSEVTYHVSDREWTAWDENWAPWAEEDKARLTMTRFFPSKEDLEKEIKALEDEGWLQAEEDGDGTDE